MKAAGPAAEVVDRTDQLDTAVKFEYTAVWAADDTAVAVDDVDMDVSAAAAVVGDRTSEEQSKLQSFVTRSVLLGKKDLHFILQPS